MEYPFIPNDLHWSFKLLTLDLEDDDDDDDDDEDDDDDADDEPILSIFSFSNLSTD